MNSHSEDHTTKKEWVICGVSIFGSAGRYLATSFSSKFYSTDFFLETGNWRWALLSQVPGVCVTQVARARFLEGDFNLIWCQGRVLTGGF